MNSDEALARQLARDWLNAERTKARLAPIKRISPLWWKMHGPEWLKKARVLKQENAR